MPDYLVLSELKERLKKEHTHEDALLTRFLDAAEGYIGDPANGVLGRPVMPTAFTDYFDGFECVNLRHPDGAAITSLGYMDSTGTPQTVGAIYTLREGRLVLNFGEVWPSKTGVVTVDYTAGFAVVPEQIKDAAYFYASSLAESRTSEEMDPERLRKMVSLMISGYRRIGL